MRGCSRLRARLPARTERRAPLREFAEAVLGDAHAGERIVARGRRSRRRRGRGPARTRATAGATLRRTRAGTPRRPSRRTAGRSASSSRLLVRPAGARVERPLVQRDKEDGVVVPEDVLRAVAVVHVEVDDRDALGAGAPARQRAATATLLNRQKPIARSRRRVVAGRTHEGERASLAPLRSPCPRRAARPRSSSPRRACRRRATSAARSRESARGARACGTGESPPRSPAGPRSTRRRRAAPRVAPAAPDGCPSGGVSRAADG